MMPTTHWPSLDAFVDMGGYGLYVWGAVLVAIAAMALEAWALMRRRKQALRRVRQVLDAISDRPSEAPL